MGSRLPSLFSVTDSFLVPLPVVVVVPSSVNFWSFVLSTLFVVATVLLPSVDVVSLLVDLVVPDNVSLVSWVSVSELVVLPSVLFVALTSFVIVSVFVLVPVDCCVDFSVTFSSSVAKPDIGATQFLLSLFPVVEPVLFFEPLV